MYDSHSHTLSLIDFGATRTFSKDFIRAYFTIINGAVARDEATVIAASIELKFLTGFESKAMMVLFSTAIDRMRMCNQCLR